MPLLEETGHMPSEKYAHAPEIRDHCSNIGRQYDLYDNALFHTQVTDLAWDEARQLWIVRTDRGDAFTAKYVGMGTGPLHVAKLPGLPGIELFEGKSFHTSRWDYGYTGGTPEGEPMTGLADAHGRVGTGATAVQVVPNVARDAQELYVFQRTPSSVDERNNRPLERDWFDSVTGPGWQKAWQENFVANLGVGFPAEDLVDDGWTDLGKRIRAQVIDMPPEQRTPEGIMAAFEDADNQKMSEIRARAEQIVGGEAGEKLKAWYRQLCKRPCFHDEYLQAFTRPTRIWSIPTARVSSGSPPAESSPMAANMRSIASSMPRVSRSAPASPSARATMSPGAAAGSCPNTGPAGCAASTGCTSTAFPTCSSSSRTRRRPSSPITRTIWSTTPKPSPASCAMPRNRATRRSNPARRPSSNGSTSCSPAPPRGLAAPNARPAITTMKGRATASGNASRWTIPRARSAAGHIDQWQAGTFRLDFALTPYMAGKRFVDRALLRSAALSLVQIEERITRR